MLKMESCTDMQNQLMLIWYVEYYLHHTILSLHKIIIISVSNNKIVCSREKDGMLAQGNFSRAQYWPIKNCKKI